MATKQGAAVRVAITDIGINDKLINIMSGLGTQGDKATHTQGVFVELTFPVLSQMYASNWMARKIVDLPVDDMMGTPRIVSSPLLGDKLDAFVKYSEKKKIALNKKAKKTLKWARLYGGAVIVMGIEGAGDPETPLNINSIPKDGLKFLHVVSRHKMSIQKMDHDALSETYDEPLMFRLEGGQQIHASRVVPVRGIQLPEEINLLEDYWGISVLQHTEEPVMQTQTILAQLASMVFEANVDTISVRGLSQKLATKDGQKQLIERFRVGNRMKSTHQLMLFDQDMETYARNPMDIGKFPELVPQFMSVVSGASEIPATRFLGKSPDGMNATGNSDDRMYLDKLGDMQEDDLSDIYDKIDPVILMSTYGKVPDDWGYEFPNLWNLDAKDEAEVTNKNAMTDQLNLVMGVVNEYHISDRVQKSGYYPALSEDDVEDVKKAIELGDQGLGDTDEDDLAVDGTKAPEDEEEVETVEEPTSTATPADGHPLEGEEPVQSQALNGAQIGSLVAIATKVANGEIDRESAIAIVMVSVPGITEAQAGEIVGEEMEKEDVPPALENQPVPPPGPQVPPPPAPPEDEEE